MTILNLREEYRPERRDFAPGLLHGFLEELIFVGGGEKGGERLLPHKLSDTNRLDAVAGIGALGQQIDFEIFGYQDSVTMVRGRSLSSAPGG